MNLESKNKLIRYLKYCMVGGIGVIIDFSIFTILVKIFQINYLVANIFSISIALIFVYYLQKNWTFKYQIKEHTKTFQRYLISVALTYLFNNGVLVIFIQVLRFEVLQSKVIQIVLSTILGYILTNYFVFAKRDNT
jgi:putative flippase GtrA